MIVGLDPDDNWLCYQFDVAIFSFGRHVEAKMSERDDKGNQIHKIEDILAGQEDEFVSISKLMVDTGTMVMAF